MMEECPVADTGIVPRSHALIADNSYMPMQRFVRSPSIFAVIADIAVST
jgi:hypothetical protein